MSSTVVVIATYREADTIGPLVQMLCEFGWSVIVVDDSDDDTAERARAMGAHVIHRDGKQGIASAYKLGFEHALMLDPDVIVQMDAGGTHEPSTAIALAELVRMGRGVVIGSRFWQPVKNKSYRTRISLGAAWLMQRLGVPVVDATSGFRGWNPDVLAGVLPNMRAHGFAFQLETLWHAHKAGAVIEEIPIPYRMTNSTFQWGMVWEALRVWARLAVKGA